MQEFLAGWRDDLDPAWRAVVAETGLGFADIDPGLTLAAGEPIFPPRKGRVFPGAPKGAHVFRAFDDIAPDQVRCVILGQDPYPCPAFATGRAFEAGNVADWRELEKMFSTSVRTFMQQIAEARTGDPGYVGSTAGWYRLIGDAETGGLDLEPAASIAERWVASGALLLNSSFTLSRFAVTGDPHQVRGHLPLWRPLVARILDYLAARGTPVVFIGFGDQAATVLGLAGITEGVRGRVGCVVRAHPADAAAVLALENPFVAANRMLGAMGAGPVSW
ncbi:MAG: uracil-DNA glycosylase [Bauldia sp.]|nr:uracil-DNA glycosylase [Bauldia sp.]